ncbi:MAG: SRPBCC domain-containing protein [Kiloniellales bacterium]
MTARLSKVETGSDREIVLTRLFDAPRELVFEAWSDPAQLAQWWGPDGFTTTTHTMDLRPGGVWRFVMHGPDGRDYPNKVTYIEVERPSRLVYRQGGEEDLEDIQFHVTVTFEAQGGKTKVTLRSVFPSAAARDRVVKDYDAIEGGRQHLARLAGYLETMAQDRGTSHEFSITRTFDAPRDLVWRAWSEAERLAQWWGPKGFVTSIKTLAFRPGGIFHYRMDSSGGQVMWGRFVYREIVAPERIVYVNAFSDAAGAMTRAPFAGTWPLEMLTTVTFVEQGGKTTVALTVRAINATAEERATFEDGFKSMEGGFGATFDQLAKYLAQSRD